MALDPDDDAFAEQLFEAARGERPPPQAKHRALAVSHGEAEGDAARGIQPKRAMRAVQWLSFAAALGALGALVSWPSKDESRTASSIDAEPVPIAIAPPSALPQHAAVLAPPPEPKTPAPAQTPASARNTASASLTVPPPLARNARSATLEEELGMLDGVRQALLGGDPGAALAGLAQYDKLATSRYLVAEATLLRIQILRAAGRSSEASRLAREFVTANPNNPLVDRAKSFIHEPVTPEQSQ
jgi:hypothetical protein